MTTARTLGISLKRLDGWVGERETVYEYDDAGRVRVARTWVESEWDPEQAAMMMALAQYDSLQCSGCGLDVRDTMAPEAEHAYNADEPWVCAGCMAIHLGQKKFAASDELTSAHRFVPERR